MCGFFISNDPLISDKHKFILDNHLKFRGPDYQSKLINFKNWKIYHARLAIIGLHSIIINHSLIKMIQFYYLMVKY